jgi:hypothetical protein
MSKEGMAMNGYSEWDMSVAVCSPTNKSRQQTGVRKQASYAPFYFLHLNCVKNTTLKFDKIYTVLSTAQLSLVGSQQ